MQFSTTTYEQFVRLISEQTGIQLGENRVQMLRNRIAGRVRQLGMQSYEEYLRLLRGREAPEELRTLIDSVTTNYTAFFRDPAQFQHFGQIVEQLLKSGKPKVRIWSAACSTGEEVYSLAISAFLAAERVQADIDRVRILATDISQKVLSQAFLGIYPQKRISGLSTDYQRFFEVLPEASPEARHSRVQVHQSLRRLTIFRRINLCDQPLPIPAGIDVIFLRNVLIYFDTEMVKSILQECESKLNSGGFLYVGSCESVSDYLPHFEVARPCVFRAPNQLSHVNSEGNASSSFMEILDA